MDRLNSRLEAGRMSNRFLPFFWRLGVVLALGVVAMAMPAFAA
jgi:hypothetical protein